MDAKGKAESRTFLAWLTGQTGREDVVGVYARAIADDFAKGRKFGLVDSAIAVKAQDWDAGNILRYCSANGLPTQSADFILLGHAMGLVEYCVGVLTGTIEPPYPLDSSRCDQLRKTIAETCDVIPAILQDMDSSSRGG